MGLIQNDADTVAGAISPVTTPLLESEAEYEKWIYELLHERFPHEVFHRQYTKAKTKADIFVEFRLGGAAVVVEVKYKLTSRGEFHRLIGQSWEYLHLWKSELVVCICGDSDPALVKLANEATRMLVPALSKARVLHMPPGR